MGNTLSGKKVIKVMKVEGTTLKLKPPAQAEAVLRDYPGYDLFKADEVRRLGIEARPLHPDAPLLSKDLYFLVELPRVPDPRGPRKAWSGALQLSAKERLESLRLARRTMSDISPAGQLAGCRLAKLEVEASENRSALRLKVRLPKAEVERIMQGSEDAAEVAEKIMKLCGPQEGGKQKAAAAPPAPALTAGRKEKRARFAAMPDEIMAETELIQP